MVARLVRSVRLSKRAGHILVLAAVVSVLLVMVVGLTVDSGLVYGKKAKLSKAADAAAFAGLSNVSQGESQAIRIAEQVFHSNYLYDPQSPGTDYQAPTIDIEFVTNSSNNRAIVIDAHAFAAPLFGRILGLTQFNLSAHAEASRAKLVLSLALDRSGSMNGNGGCSALPPAANAFVDFFDEAYDRMSLTTYASHARLDVPMTTNFKAPVHAAVPVGCNTVYGGFTFIDGGLGIAGAQNASVVPGPGEDLVKVIVLFTDGLANTFQGTFDCPPQTLINLSGSDAVSNPNNEVWALHPLNGAVLCQTPMGGTFACCPSLLTFTELRTGMQLDARNPVLVREEAKDRAIIHARQMRLEGNVIYTIGLGNNLDADFLMRIANDRRSPYFTSSQPEGEFSQAPTAAELQAVFLRLARLITLRLSA
ncbi:MAG: pilus assembly protein TadG-related protein [Planctomycetota bacterium]